MYKFEIKFKDKVVLITLKRLISLEESYKIFEDLIGRLKTFDTSKYNLVVDTGELKASKQDCVIA
ncbi:hypothetical protein [Clostridium sp.]|uniref:hypothetical protein n=1 Tax=Clostridium sp. TaxID=1506 RepID=UPI002FDCD759